MSTCMPSTSAFAAGFANERSGDIGPGSRGGKGICTELRFHRVEDAIAVAVVCTEKSFGPIAQSPDVADTVIIRVDLCGGSPGKREQ